MYRAKRIIAGKTYNTETASLIARWDDPETAHPVTYGEHLYKSRFGAFFVYSYVDDGPEGPEADLRPLTPEEARGWLEEHRGYDVELIEALFGRMPEAGSGESKFTLRLPDTLRDRLAGRAKASGQSLNAWIVRRLERCVADEPPDLPRTPR